MNKYHMILVHDDDRARIREDVYVIDGNPITSTTVATRT
jgi:hypothetical protein